MLSAPLDSGLIGLFLVSAIDIGSFETANGIPAPFLGLSVLASIPIGITAVDFDPRGSMSLAHPGANGSFGHGVHTCASEGDI